MQLLTNRWVLGAVGMLVISIVAFLAGMRVESNHRDALLLAQERADHDAYIAQTKRLQGNASDVAKKMLAERNKLVSDLTKLRREYNGKNLATCSPGGDVGVNIGMWNAALTVGMSRSSDSTGADARAANAGIAPPEEVFDNLIENASRWHQCRQLLRGWQALAVKNGWVN